MNRVWWKTLVRKLDYTPLPASGWRTLHPQKIFGPKVTTGQGFINAGCMKYNYIRTSTNRRFPRMPHLHPSTYRTQNPLWQRYVLVSILEIVIYIYMKTGPIMYSFYKIISFICLAPNQVLQKACVKISNIPRKSKEHPEAQRDHQRKCQAHEEGMQSHVALRSICGPCQGPVSD